MSRCCIEPYSGCTKSPSEQDRTPRPKDRTRTSQGATAPSSLRIHLVAPVWLLMSGLCIEQYREGFTKTPCTPDSTQWRAGLACALSESYTKRMRCYGTSQFVCTAYVAYTTLNVLVLYRTVQLMYANSVCTRLDPMAWGSYTYCNRCYGTFQFAYTSCGRCMASYVRMLYRTVQWV